MLAGRDGGSSCVLERIQYHREKPALGGSLIEQQPAPRTERRCHVLQGAERTWPEQRLAPAPQHLAFAAGVRSEHVRRLVEIAVADMCHQTNPRPCTAADFERLFAEAM
jgi:hypothetical protein